VGLLAATRAQLMAKRALDVVVSLAALIALAPVLLLAAVAVAATSRGPVFYVHDRLGRDGRPFRMVKLRSMHRSSEQHRDRYLAMNEREGPVFKIRDDPRVTPVGRILRKLSIDELPQLLNVLRGDMSLVGPRPPLPHEVEDYGPREAQRLRVQPGLTCIWQVSGRSDVSFDRWVEMDLAYIRRWSLRLDLVLLLRTVPAVLTCRGAY
jgi:lipopolysaccharide/colanic/teichoic acid biosynthesis glycosyltransferase